MEQLVEEFGGHEYYYQNQADMPDDITENEWDERRDFWDEAVGDDTWVERGLSFQHKPEMSRLIYEPDVREHADQSMLLGAEKSALSLTLRLVCKRVFADQEFRPSTLRKVEKAVRKETGLRSAIEGVLAAITLDSLFEPLPVSDGPSLTDEIQEMALAVALRFMDEEG